MLKGFVYPKLTKETQVGRIVIPSTNSDRTRNRWGVGVGSPDTIIEYDDIATDTSVASDVTAAISNAGAGPAAVYEVTSNYTVTTDGEIALTVTAPETALYRVELIVGGIYYGGSLGDYNGSIQGYAVADISGESDQTNTQTNFRTWNDVVGFVVFERDHSSKVYSTGIDLFWRSATRTDDDGTEYGQYQQCVLFIEEGGSVDIYLKDAGTNGVYAGVPTGGFYQILSGSKLQLQKLATFSYPPSL